MAKARRAGACSRATLALLALLAGAPLALLAGTPFAQAAPGSPCETYEPQLRALLAGARPAIILQKAGSRTECIVEPAQPQSDARWAVAYFDQSEDPASAVQDLRTVLIDMHQPNVRLTPEPDFGPQGYFMVGAVRSTKTGYFFAGHSARISVTIHLSRPGQEKLKPEEIEAARELMAQALRDYR